MQLEVTGQERGEMGQGLGCPAISESAVPRAVGGRQKAHPLYMEKCCSRYSNHSSAATLDFFHGLEFRLLQLQGLSSRPGRCTGIMLTGTFMQLHCGAKCCRERTWELPLARAPCPHLLLLCAHQLPKKLCKNSAFVSEARRR